MPKKKITNATDNHNSIVEVSEPTLDILNKIKNKAVLCRENHKNDSAALECAPK